MAEPEPFRYEIKDIQQDEHTKVLSVLCVHTSSFEAQLQPAMVVRVASEMAARIAAAFTVALAKSEER